MCDKIFLAYNVQRIKKSPLQIKFGRPEIQVPLNTMTSTLHLRSYYNELYHIHVLNIYYWWSAMNLGPISVMYHRFARILSRWAIVTRMNFNLSLRTSRTLANFPVTNLASWISALAIVLNLRFFHISSISTMAEADISPKKDQSA